MIDQFFAAKVTRLYNGVNGKCCCGCAGKYTERGEEGFERRLKMFVKKFNRLQDEDSEFVSVADNHVAFVSGAGNGRVTIAYFD